MTAKTVLDPTPGATALPGTRRNPNIGPPPMPYGCPLDMVIIPNETAEQRAFRRFPINSHKPGP